MARALVDFLAPFLPTDDEYGQKEATRRQLQELARQIHPAAQLLAFGSMANGFALRYSDMDLCCIIPPDGEDRTASELVEELGALIRRDTDFIVLSLPHARIPIIKIRQAPTSDVPYEIACDIGFNNEVALANTHLLLTYAQLDPQRLRALVLFLKVWAKRRKLNSPFTGTLSSYGYTLLVLFFLVHVKQPAVLPNLQRIPSDTPLSRDDVMLGGHNVYFYDNMDVLSQTWHSMNTESVGELLLDFFRYFSRDFHYARDAISMRTEGGLVAKETHGWSADFLGIEDPFQRGYNVARTVTKDGLYTIRGEFMRASRLLANRSVRAHQLLAELCAERDDGLMRAPDAASQRHQHGRTRSLQRMVPTTPEMPPVLPSSLPYDGATLSFPPPLFAMPPPVPPAWPVAPMGPPAPFAEKPVGTRKNARSHSESSSDPSVSQQIRLHMQAGANESRPPVPTPPLWPADLALSPGDALAPDLQHLPLGGHAPWHAETAADDDEIPARDDADEDVFGMSPDPRPSPLAERAAEAHRKKHRARPYDAPRLHMDDYYARAREFRAWLATREQFVDELTSDEARRAFRAFADAWNAGTLDATYYTGTVRSTPSRYPWASALDKKRVEAPLLPATPCVSDAERRAERAATQAWLDEHAPRATGRDAMIEKKKERAASHRAMAERHQLDDDVADGLSDEALLGTGSSFAAALAERERAAQRRAARRAEARKEATEARAARLAALQRKKATTIAQLRHMAAQRYG
ncbi:RNA uridylyltransferase [Malassezia equina]|uniref:polynucleotide adenylyltransferase n=1 Tax=Malassezia equina TaxID=1381935 RepID=A0AAF0EG19_9BASI|nr:RNA uridylyltransferase [Malassezia equina]